MLFRLGVPSFIFGIIGAFPFAYIFGKTYAITKDSLHLVFEYTYASNLKVFPGLDVYISVSAQETIIQLPNSPDIVSQFKASFSNAIHLGNNCYSLPIAAEKAVWAWVNTVRGGKAK